MIEKMIKRSMALMLVCLLPMQAAAYIGLCCAKCGGNMPMNIPGGGIPETYEFRLKIQPMIMHMSGLQQDNRQVSVDSVLGMPVMMGKPTGMYMAAPTSMDMNMLNLSMAYSFGDDFAMSVMTMYSDKRMAMRFNATMSTTTGRADYTMQSQGFADTMLMAKYRIFANNPLFPSKELSLFAALSIPTGSITERNTTHPLAMRQSELLPYSMQLGSGTWEPTLGLLFQRSSSPLWWGVDARYTHRLGQNTQGYRLGSEAKLDAYLMYQAAPSWVFYGQINAISKARMHGESYEASSGASGRVVQGDATSPYMSPMWNPAFTGKSQVFSTFGWQWQPKPLHVLDLGLQVPLYQRMQGLQLKDRWRVMLSYYIELPTHKSIRSLSYSARDTSLGF